jgi:hypothetical protein
MLLETGSARFEDDDMSEFRHYRGRVAQSM